MKLSLETFSDLLELFDIILHVLKKRLLLVLLLLLFICLFSLLQGHILLELVEKGRELSLQVIVSAAQFCHALAQV